MTQQLQQSIKLLQMTSLEVQAFIEQQLEDNPFLAPDERVGDEGPPDGEERREDVRDESPADSQEESFMPEEWREDAGFGDGSQLRTPVTARDHDGDTPDFDDNRAHALSLREHLMEQLPLACADPLLKRLCTHLIDLVDESGYMKEDISALADQLGTDRAHMERALAVLQQLDPCGVGARTLQECLSLQLRERDRLDPAMQALLEHLHLLAEGNIEALKRKCGVDGEDLREMITEIRALNPKPGQQFTHDLVQPVEPDISVRRDNTGNWHVELNTAALPRVLVNKRYYAKIVVGSKGADKKYMTDKIHEAGWLIKALDQRANTILKVAGSIVGAQENFFRMGIHHLKPLTLKDIAKETGFHESTISRVTSGKYLISPRGTLELKYFFTSGLSHKAGGDDVSSQTVKHLIKELIDKELPTAILSDDDLADRLKARNINVARRTVAKYREALNIPSSMQRRRQRIMLAS